MPTARFIRLSIFSPGSIVLWVYIPKRARNKAPGVGGNTSTVYMQAKRLFLIIAFIEIGVGKYGRKLNKRRTGGAIGQELGTLVGYFDIEGCVR